MKSSASFRYILITGLVAIVIGSGHIDKGHNPADASSGKISTVQTDPLRSWNDGGSKKAITQFVKTITAEGSPNYVEVKDRIAVFDNDGTLWAEQPLYFQFQFAIF